MIATLITNGYLLSRDRIRRLNRAGLDHLQISIDNVTPDEVSKKSLKVLDQKLRYGFEHLRREYHRVKRCAPLCTVGCVHRVAQVDELRQTPRTWRCRSGFRDLNEAGNHACRRWSES
jgi:hypothetical protein